MKKNIGVVIGVRDTNPDSPKYLLDERGEYMHFDSVEEADEYMENNGMNAGRQKNSYVLQYHTFCLNCGKEYFLNPSETFVDELGRGYYCDECDSSFDVI